MLTIVGLGMEPEDLTYRAQHCLKKADKIYLRTAMTPHAAFLQTLGFHYESLDALYEQSEDYEELCEEIAQTVTEEANSRKIVYACPGSAVIGDETVRVTAQLCMQKEIPFRMLPGISPADTAAADALGATNLLFLSADQVKASLLNPRFTLIVEEIDDVYLASQVKLELMEAYPEDCSIYLGKKKIDLIDLDRQEIYNEHTTLLIPPLSMDAVSRYDVEYLMEVLRRLRNPVHGCPWEKELTHASIKRTLLEECYEVNQAVDDDDMEALTEEIGDTLMQLLLHVCMAEERGEMNLRDVMTGICSKMITRHEEIFSKQKVADAAEMTALWDQNKRKDRGNQTRTDSMVYLPKSFPALLRAEKVQSKAALVGFDWDKAEDALQKVTEETDEFLQAMHENDSAQLYEEIGDLLFSVVNVARMMKLSPEMALQKATDKFISRFAYIEEGLKKRQLTFEEVTLADMDQLWDEAKKIEKT